MSGRQISIRLEQDRPIPLDVSLSCAAGEMLVIVGPSGSGKTTILRSISGLYTPKSGVVRCHGEQWLNTRADINLPVQKRRIGMVFQHYALFPHMSALENIMVSLRQVGIKQKTAIAEQWLKTMHMEGLGARYPAELSGGQQQRIALARALARDPDVLLLDEPFSAVDQQTKRKLTRELVTLKGQFNLPIIHVTHDLNEARRIADKMCIIHRGRTLQLDSPEQVMNHPVDSNVAHLIGHYNVFSGKVLKHDHDTEKTHIHWHGYDLEAAYRPQIAVDTEIDWLIPDEHIILHRRDRPSRGERENPVSGSVEELIPLGASSAITMKVHATDRDLSLSIPTHVAHRNHIKKDSEITVSLLCEGIHLMEKGQG